MVMNDSGRVLKSNQYKAFGDINLDSDDLKNNNIIDSLGIFY